MNKLKLRLKLWLDSGNVEGVFGGGKCRLLKNIATMAPGIQSFFVWMSRS